jgi:hypothetical protein
MTQQAVALILQEMAELRELVKLGAIYKAVANHPPSSLIPMRFYTSTIEWPMHCRRWQISSVIKAQPNFASETHQGQLHPLSLF